MKSKPQFSILLPTHNRAEVLQFAIHSVLAQTVEDFELLIVGDGCTDNTADVVTSFNDPRIRWFGLPKAPYFGYANRNIALRQAKGALIAFMAHDDLWLPDHLEILSNAFKDEKTEIAYSRPMWVVPDGAIVPGTFDLRENRTLDSFLNRKRNGIPAGCVAHRRTCFSKYGYGNESLPKCGDWDWKSISENPGKWASELRSAIKWALSQQVAEELEEIEKSFSVKFSNRLRGVKNRIFHPGTVRGRIRLRLMKRHL